MKKKLFVLLSILIVLFAFTACDDTNKPIENALLSEESIAELEKIMETFPKVFNHYSGKTDSKTYVNSQKIATDLSDSFNADFFYIKIGNHGNVETVTLDQKYNADDKFTMSIGDNVFYQDVAFKVDEEVLYINKPILYIYLLTNDTVEIDGEKYTCNIFMQTVEDLELSEFKLTDDNWADPQVLTPTDGNIVSVPYSESTSKYGVEYKYENMAECDILFFSRSTKNGDEITYDTALDKIVSGINVRDYLMYSASGSIDDYVGVEKYRSVIVFDSSLEIKGKYNVTFVITSVTNET